MILFYPELPRNCNKIWFILRELGVSYHNDYRKPFKMVFCWNYDTIANTTPTVCDEEKTPIYNRGGRDVSKSRVEHIFSKVFGYSSFVDKGPCIEKSETQAANDAVLMTEPRFLCDKVYQKPLKNLVRVPIFKDNIPFVIRKIPQGDDYRPVLLSTDTVFSTHELDLIIEFCQQFDVQFAELDTMRDDEGKLYIIDVNNVAGARLFRKIPQIIPTYAQEFKKSFL